MNTGLHADIQIACDTWDVPSDGDIEAWASQVIAEVGSSTKGSSEVSIRVVDEAESRALNLRFRDQDQPTNVLSFPAELPDIGAWPEETAIPLGDLVICAPIVVREATEQGKAPAAHWAHMLVHGMLHLLGYDHETDQQAEAMESIEVRVLRAGGVRNPYEGD